jgi:hypothetical protein
MFRDIDSFLLARAQKFCDAFQRLTGLTKFCLEKWAFVMSALSLISYLVLTLMDIGPVAMVYLLLPGAIYAFSTVADIKRIERDEQNFLLRGELHWNDRHISGFRLLVLGSLTVLGLALLVVEEGPQVPFALTAFAAYTVGTYIGACMPRPPGKSKLRQWYENALTWLGEWLREEPSPTPA